jgi:Tol biopolymer transport system component
MGEVWRGRDTRLGRDVAVKILAEKVAQNEQFRARFDREAKVISSLNHPNICTLFDVGEHESMNFLIMELIEGESLADRLSKGPLPPDQVLRYGAQIAEALDRAHKQGIVHRDLKPGNVMLTKTGAKLLDFGLARSDFDGGRVHGLTEMPTQARPLTQEGMILGTFQYMAPEQLEGVEVDARTDIFALGALLYEMATGQRAFKGNSRTSLIAAIVSSHPPPVSQISPMSPPALDHVLRKCLEKDPDDRWQSAHDVAAELHWIAEAGSQAGVASPIMLRRKNRERLAWGLNIVTAAIAVAAAWMFFQNRQPPRHKIETSIVAPAGYRAALNGGLALSPDGANMAAVFIDERGERSLWLRSLSANRYRQIDGTREAAYPFWSPDGRSVGFFADGKMKVVDVNGGGMRVICDAPTGRGATWNAEGTLIVSQSTAEPLMKVSANGGTPVPLTALRKGETSHRWPSFLPDGRRFLFVIAGPGGSRLAASSLDDPSKITVLFDRGSAAQYVPAGFILFTRDNALIAQRYDASHERLTGDPVTISEQIALTDRYFALFSVSRDGTVLLQRGTGFFPTQIVWSGRDGKPEGVVTSTPGLYFCPSLSHDGRRLAIDSSNTVDGNGDIWIYDLQRNVGSRLTYDVLNESSPLWTSDDKHIVYYSGALGSGGIYTIAAGGTGKGERLSTDQLERRPTDVSRDGKWILFNTLGGAAGVGDVGVWSTEEKKGRPLLATPFLERCAQLSPDAKWVTYESDESGRGEIYVRSFPESEEKWRISVDGGSMPAWRADGRELYYISSERKMMAVAVTTTPSFQAGTPVPLFKAELRDHPTRQYDVTADGKHFVLNQQMGSGPAEPLTLIQNWN